MRMEIGIRNSLETKVAADNTAAAIGSGTLAVFATPAMTALIEETAWRNVAACLADGQTTVGTKLDISHVSPTPVGMNVRCETELVGIDGRRLTFKVDVYDERGLIGTGTHERFIVMSEKFQAKADGKRLEL